MTPEQYRDGRLLEPIAAFRTSRMGGPEVETRYDGPVSFGIRRAEFDQYLLQRSGARVRTLTPVTSVRRINDRWIVNDRFASPILIGAGGHFCPVARLLDGSLGSGRIVVAQEVEFRLDDPGAPECRIRSDTPELYLCRDLKGYGWCFRKGAFLNVGLGREDRHELARHVRSFVAFLATRRKVVGDLPSWKGHAYLLYGSSPRHLLGDGVLLIGDAAGLAYTRSGEGIRPAVESGLLAAAAVLAAGGRYSQEDLEPYRERLLARFGAPTASPDLSRALPPWLTNAVAGRLLGTRWFARRVFLDRWFLRVDQPALRLSRSQPHPRPASAAL